MDTALSAPCYDPGVNEDAFIAITELRYALRSCSRKQQALVVEYEEVAGPQ